MPTKGCPSCKREVDITVEECPFCMVIFKKWDARAMGHTITHEMSTHPNLKYRYDIGEKSRLPHIVGIFVGAAFLITAGVYVYLSKTVLLEEEWLAQIESTQIHPSTFGSPEEVYKAYRQALIEEDIKTLIDLSAPEPRKELESSARDVILPLLKAVSPVDEKIVSASQQGTRATILLEGSSLKQKGHGKVDLLLDDGAWKVHYISWKYNSN